MNNWAYAVKAGREATEGQQSVAVTTASATSTNPVGASGCVIYSTVECFVVAGITATVAIGTPIPANTLVPLKGFNPTDKISVIAATGSGTLYIRPNA